MNPIVLRKRYIPSEVVDISGDQMIYRDEELLITRWKPIKPRKDIARGISFTFLKEGYKVSKFIGHENDFKYWYCDIINVQYNKDEDKYVLVDLILDVKIMPDNSILVLDADELATGLEDGIITIEEASKSLRTMNKVLEMAYEGNFPPKVCFEYE